MMQENEPIPTEIQKRLNRIRSLEVKSLHAINERHRRDLEHLIWINIEIAKMLDPDFCQKYLKH